MQALADHLERLLANNGEVDSAAQALEEALGSEHESLRERAAGLLIDALLRAGPGPRARILELLQAAWWPPSVKLAERAHTASLGALAQLTGDGQEVADAVLLWTQLARAEPAEVTRIGEALDHPAWAVRKAAAGAMGRLVDADRTHLARLVERLEDPDERVAVAALEALGSLALVDPGQAVAALRAEVRKRKGERRFSALSALRGLMEEAAREGIALPAEAVSQEPSLTEALGAPEEGVRLQAAAVLGLRGQRAPAIEAALGGALADHNADVAATAAAALLRLGAAEKAPLELLGGLLTGTAREGQEAAFTALEPLDAETLARARPVLEAAASGTEAAIHDAARALLDRLD